MPRGFSERATVQDPLVKYAAAIGWNLACEADQLALRQGEAGLFFYQVMRDKLLTFNRDVVTATNVDDVIKRMEQARPSIEGNEDILLWLPDSGQCTCRANDGRSTSRSSTSTTSAPTSSTPRTSGTTPTDGSATVQMSCS